MSDRKTTEIKLRLSPGEKMLWQLAAEQREVGLSQFIRDCVQESIWDGRASAAQDDEDSSIERAVPTSGVVDLVTSPRKSWMFEGANGD